MTGRFTSEVFILIGISQPRGADWVEGIWVGGIEVEGVGVEGWVEGMGVEGTWVGHARVCCTGVSPSNFTT